MERTLPLRAIELRGPPPGLEDRFPFSVPALRGLTRLELTRAVTYLVGENGSGKSTLLESVALASRVPTVGSRGAERDDTLRAQKRLAKHLRLVWSSRTHRGFFLRAEDFFGWVREQRRQRAELREDLAEQQERLADASEYARTLAAGPYRRSLGEMEERYGEDPDARSHGESFLDLFRARFVPRGLYLLDEPEAALSPQSQLGLVALVKEMVDSGSQFIVATHSPILLAVPGAELLSFDRSPVAPVEYDDLDSVRLYREFLQAPARYLRHLWA